MHAFRTAGVLAIALLTSGATALAQVESTPVPQSAKPDFSKMQFLNGTWNCTVLSSRRPGPYHTTVTTAMDSSGYWQATKTTIHKASWIPASFVAQDRLTYDPTTSRWVDVTTDDLGGYDLSTSPGWKGNAIVWTDQFYPKSNNTATNNPTTISKISAKKTVSTATFKEPRGRLVSVKTTCTKA